MLLMIALMSTADSGSQHRSVNISVSVINKYGKDRISVQLH